jgi:aspartyl-tRNA(Asn)/glutamyl-tRNA(Gln) amidotransferase subunit A
MARDATDLAVVWNALTGARATPADAGLRVAAPGEPSDVVEVDTEVEDAIEQAISVLTDSGARRIAVDIPHFGDWAYPRSIPLMTEALQVHKEAGWFPDRAADYEQGTLEAHRYAEALPADALDTAYRELGQLRARLLRAFESADVLVLPATPVPAPTKTEAKARDGAHRPPVTRTLTRICGPVNYCDLAAVSIPCGFTAGGLPIGLQIIGRAEHALLGVALLYQRSTDWHTRLPPLSSP